MKLNKNNLISQITNSIGNIINFCEQNIEPDCFMSVEKVIQIPGDEDIVTIYCYLNNYRRVKGDNQHDIKLKYGSHFIRCEQSTQEIETLPETILKFVDMVEEYLSQWSRGKK